jgi:ATP-dependent exoDNAse (exonuclease V) alpha subunit
MGVTFAPEQQEALKTVTRNRVAIITGGPGKGKIEGLTGRRKNE